MDNMQKIPVFFTFDANYLLAAKVAIHSMMKHRNIGMNYMYSIRPCPPKPNNLYRTV